MMKILRPIFFLCLWLSALNTSAQLKLPLLNKLDSMFPDEKMAAASKAGEALAAFVAKGKPGSG